MAEATAVRQVLTIKSIQIKTKSDGKTPFWSITSDSGDFYSVFKTDVAARLTEGQHVVMVEEKTSNGKTFRNIIGIGEPEVAAGSVDLNEIVPGGTPQVLPKAQPKTMNIINNMVDIRGHALAAAVRLCVGGVITVDKIESQARQFEPYLLHGRAGEQKSSSDATDQTSEYLE